MNFSQNRLSSADILMFLSMSDVSVHFSVSLESEGTGKGCKEKFPYSMTLHRNVRSFGANKQGQGWEKQVFLTQPIWQVQGKVNRISEKHRYAFWGFYSPLLFPLYFVSVGCYSSHTPCWCVHLCFVSQLFPDMACRVLVKWSQHGACPHLLICRAWSLKTKETIPTLILCLKTVQDGRTSRSNQIKRGKHSSKSCAPQTFLYQ